LRGARDKIAKQFCAEATKQSMAPHALRHGLLRFARNDEMPETGMTKTAFDKIKAGLEEAKAYLETLTKKRDNKARPPQQK
jgi:hypothetical protein